MLGPGLNQGRLFTSRATCIFYGAYSTSNGSDSKGGLTMAVPKTAYTDVLANI